MQINKSIVNDNNWMYGRQGHNIDKIIIHTEVGNNVSSQARFNNPASQVSVHYGVGFDGTIMEWVEESNTAYQAGNWTVNLTSIGIEHEDFGDYNGIRPDALYNASSDLVSDICRRYGIPCDRNHIFKHSEVIDKTQYPGGTACPDALDIDRIVAEANAKLNPAPAPLAPEPQPAPAILYEALAGPTRFITNKVAQVWDLSANSWDAFKSVKQLDDGAEFIAVGKAHHPLGGTYLMTAFSFGEAATTGTPAHNYGINEADLTEAPLPAETVATPTSDTTTIAFSVPDFKGTFKSGTGVYKATKDMVVKDLSGLQPDVKLGVNQIIRKGGTVEKDGHTYVLTKKSVANGSWYGILESELKPISNPVGPLVVDIKQVVHKANDDIDAIAGEVAKDPDYQKFTAQFSTKQKTLNFIGKLEDLIASLFSKLNFFKSKK